MAKTQPWLNLTCLTNDDKKDFQKFVVIICQMHL